MGTLGGGGGSSGGGGGSAGKVSWPSYLQDSHWDLIRHGQDNQSHLDTGISAFDALNSAWDNSPYRDAFTYDPTDKLSAAQDQLDAFITFIDTINTDAYDDYYAQMLAAVNGSYSEATLYPNYYAQALAAVNYAFGTDYVADQVLAQEARMIGPTMRSIARLSAGARDNNATMSSTYIQQIAYIERTHLQDLSDYSAKVAAEANAQRIAAVTAGVANVIGLHAQRVNTITGGIAHIIGLLQLKSQQEQVAVQYTIELNRIGIVAQKEFIDGDLAIASKDATWQLDLFQPVANLLAGVQGGTSTPSASKVDSTTGSSIGGALGGIAGGAQLGAALGGAGVLGLTATSGAGWGAALGAALMFL